MEEKEERTTERWFPTNVFHHWHGFLLSISHIPLCIWANVVDILTESNIFRIVICSQTASSSSSSSSSKQKRNEIMKASLKIVAAEDELSSQSE